MPLLEENTTVTTLPSESSLRRKAVRLGYKLTKLRENSRLSALFGPFVITDLSDTGSIVTGKNLEEVAEWLLRAPKVVANNVKSGTTNERRLESALYRLAKSKGFALIKYRSRTPSHPEYGHYCISVRGTSTVVHSTGPKGYGLTLNDAAEFLKTHSAL